MSNSSIEKQLDKLVQGIIREANPTKIILFGSAAQRGTVAPNDFDLLVVMPNGTHKRKTAQLLYRNIRNVNFPFDLLVATPKDLEKYKKSNILIYRLALQEGKVLYANG